MTRRALVPWAAVMAVALAYPLGVLAGGGPRFPSPAECVRPATADGGLEVVFGRFERAADASAMLARVLGAGFKGSQVEPDGCGRLKVAVHGIPTLEVGRQVVDEARSVGIRARVEKAG